MRRAGHVARTGRGVYRVSMRKSEVKNHLEDTGVEGKIILKMYLQEDRCAQTIWLRIGTRGGLL
jgi:hypothetical protein